MIVFPCYGLRVFSEIKEEWGLVVVSTYYNTYILDDKTLPSELFAERRILMLDNNYEHPIYPISHRCTSLIQVNREHRAKKTKHFIDKFGKLLKYTPKKSVTVEWKKAKCIASADGQSYLAYCEGEPYHFVVKEPYQYLAIVSWMGGRHIYDVTNEKPSKERMWRKI